MEKVAVSYAAMARWCSIAAAAQHLLAYHKFTVVFADGTRRFCKTRIRQVGTFGPLPGFAPVKLCGCYFPLKLGWQAHAFPHCVCVGLVVADVHYGLS